MTFQEAVKLAAVREDVRAAVGAIYAELQRAIDQRRPLCVASGRCCRFEEFGHRLFVTTLEMATFMAELEGAIPSDWNGAGCPFQRGKLCGVHAIRPFGCRIFFCDASSTDWQSEQYELFHSRMKQAHETLGVPYFYVEWREALALAGLTDGLSRSTVPL
jgi:Fe-S-cluster containining protein